MYRFTLLSIAAVLISMNVNAQSKLKKANDFYQKLDYAIAITHYKEHFQKHDPDAISAARLAECYRLNSMFTEAEDWYEKSLILGNKDPQVLWFYAEVLRSNGKYAEAKEQYAVYAKTSIAAADRAAMKMSACEQAITWITSPAAYEVRNEELLNSEGADFSPVQYDKGLIFSSDRTEKNKLYTTTELHGWSGRPFVKLYYVEQQKPDPGKDATAPVEKGPAASDKGMNEISWKNAEMLPASINHEYHDGPAVFSEKNKTMFFTRTKKVSVKTGEKYPDPTGWQRKSSGNYINRLEIYTAEKNEEGWTNVKPFQYNNAEEFSVGHPALSPDGKTLYFASDIPGGFGETDIYYCELKDDGTWSKPVNAGPALNTSGRESFPVISSDGVLYFSSDGHEGMGGLDLFSAKGNKNSWSDVANLRAPFNSSKDDIGIVFTKGDEEGYFSSNREGGKGLDDIYSFKKIKPQSPPPTVPVVAPVKLVFPAVYFDFDKANIRPDAQQGLDQVIAALKEDASIKVEVAAHCDCRGSDAYNMALSSKRAASAVNYLVSKGIDKSRLTPKGYGEGQTVNGCVDGKGCSDEQHQQNRRTEFKIIEEGKPVVD